MMDLIKRARARALAYRGIGCRVEGGGEIRRVEGGEMRSSSGFGGLLRYPDRVGSVGARTSMSRDEDLVCPAAPPHWSEAAAFAVVVGTPEPAGSRLPRTAGTRHPGVAGESQSRDAPRDLSVPAVLPQGLLPALDRGRQRSVYVGRNSPEGIRPGRREATPLQHPQVMPLVVPGGKGGLHPVRADPDRPR